MDSKVLSTGIPHSNLLDNYVRPESDRPRLSEVRTCENVPVIDLGVTHKLEIIQQIGDTRRDYGFFQQGPYVVPPPAGYPMNSGAVADYQTGPGQNSGAAADYQTGPGQTQRRGDGTWKGCCACSILLLCIWMHAIVCVI